MIRCSSFVILDQNSSSENEDMVESLVCGNEHLQSDQKIIDPELPSSLTASIEYILNEPETDLMSSKIEAPPLVSDTSAEATTHVEESDHLSPPITFTVEPELALAELVGAETASHREGDSSSNSFSSDLLSRGLELLSQIAKIANHLDNSSKMATLIILLVAVLFPASTIYLSSQNAARIDASNKVMEKIEADLENCQNKAHWREEKIDQLDSKIFKIQEKFTKSKKEVDNCRSSVNDQIAKNMQCQNNMESTTKKLRNLEAAQEKMTKQVIELQDKLIKYQTECGGDDSQPFLMKAFDTVFGGEKYHRHHSSSKSKCRG